VIPVLSLEGPIYCEAHEGSYTTKHFKKFVQHLLDEMNPYPEPNSVIILDSCMIHKSHSICRMVE
ncbi:hypothetical protein BS47DRAFT_1283668, partial [Hydnum rufescens UP504]